MAKTSTKKKASSASLGFEAQLWLATEYKHVVLGLTLATLRDTLVPKLLSGELSVGDLNSNQIAAP